MSFILSSKQIVISDQIPVIHLLEYDLNQYSVECFTENQILPPAQLNEWVNKRQAQFLAGRIAASKALSAHDTSFVNHTVGIGKHREPLWPEKMLGSISHALNYSIASVFAQNKPNDGIGIDLQTVLDDQEKDKIINVILTSSEAEIVQQGVMGLSENKLLSLIFSAKESFFKAVFKQVGNHFDFDAVSLKSIDTKNKTLFLIINDDICASLKKNNQFKLSYGCIKLEQADAVITACVV